MSCGRKDRHGAFDRSHTCRGWLEQYKMKKPPDGYMWSGERLTTIQATTRPDHLLQEFWSGKSTRKAAMGFQQTEARQCAKVERHRFFVDPEGIEFKETMKKRAGNFGIACGSSFGLQGQEHTSAGKPASNSTLEHQSMHAS